MTQGRWGVKADLHTAGCQHATRSTHDTGQVRREGRPAHGGASTRYTQHTWHRAGGAWRRTCTRRGVNTLHAAHMTPGRWGVKADLHTAGCQHTTRSTHDTGQVGREGRPAHGGASTRYTQHTWHRAGGAWRRTCTRRGVNTLHAAHMTPGRWGVKADLHTAGCQHATRSTHDTGQVGREGRPAHGGVSTHYTQHTWHRAGGAWRQTCTRRGVNTLHAAHMTPGRWGVKADLHTAGCQHATRSTHDTGQVGREGRPAHGGVSTRYTQHTWHRAGGAWRQTCTRRGVNTLHAAHMTPGRWGVKADLHTAGRQHATCSTHDTGQVGREGRPAHGGASTRYTQHTWHRAGGAWRQTCTRRGVNTLHAAHMTQGRWGVKVDLHTAGRQHATRSTHDTGQVGREGRPAHGGVSTRYTQHTWHRAGGAWRQTCTRRGVNTLHAAHMTPGRWGVKADLHTAGRQHATCSTHDTGQVGREGRPAHGGASTRYTQHTWHRAGGAWRQTCTRRGVNTLHAAHMTQGRWGVKVDLHTAGRQHATRSTHDTGQVGREGRPAHGGASTRYTQHTWHRAGGAWRQTCTRRGVNTLHAAHMTQGRWGVKVDLHTAGRQHATRSTHDTGQVGREGRPAHGGASTRYTQHTWHRAGGAWRQTCTRRGVNTLHAAHMTQGRWGVKVDLHTAGRQHATRSTHDTGQVGREGGPAHGGASTRYTQHTWHRAGGAWRQTCTRRGVNTLHAAHMTPGRWGVKADLHTAGRQHATRSTHDTGQVGREGGPAHSGASTRYTQHTWHRAGGAWRRTCTRRGVNTLHAAHMTPGRWGVKADLHTAGRQHATRSTHDTGQVGREGRPAHGGASTRYTQHTWHRAGGAWRQTCTRRGVNTLHAAHMTPGRWGVKADLHTAGRQHATRSTHDTGQVGREGRPAHGGVSTHYTQHTWHRAGGAWRQTCTRRGVNTLHAAHMTPGRWGVKADLHTAGCQHATCSRHDTGQVGREGGPAHSGASTRYTQHTWHRAGRAWRQTCTRRGVNTLHAAHMTPGRWGVKADLHTAGCQHATCSRHDTGQVGREGGPAHSGVSTRYTQHTWHRAGGAWRQTCTRRGVNTLHAAHDTGQVGREGRPAHGGASTRYTQHTWHRAGGAWRQTCTQRGVNTLHAEHMTPGRWGVKADLHTAGRQHTTRSTWHRAGGAWRQTCTRRGVNTLHAAHMTPGRWGVKADLHTAGCQHATCSRHDTGQVGREGGPAHSGVSTRYTQHTWHRAGGAWRQTCTRRGVNTLHAAHDTGQVGREGRPAHGGASTRYTQHTWHRAGGAWRQTCTQRGVNTLHAAHMTQGRWGVKADLHTAGRQHATRSTHDTGQVGREGRPAHGGASTRYTQHTWHRAGEAWRQTCTRRGVNTLHAAHMTPGRWGMKADLHTAGRQHATRSTHDTGQVRREGRPAHGGASTRYTQHTWHRAGGAWRQTCTRRGVNTLHAAHMTQGRWGVKADLHTAGRQHTTRSTHDTGQVGREGRPAHGGASTRYTQHTWHRAGGAWRQTCTRRGVNTLHAAHDTGQVGREGRPAHGGASTHYTQHTWHRAGGAWR